MTGREQLSKPHPHQTQVYFAANGQTVIFLGSKTIKILKVRARYQN
jgi:hypothetical protein